ncbi:MAG: acyl-ACP thioesterase domain-containing protein [Candidatus Goldiibacteriota bacterium]
MDAPELWKQKYEIKVYESDALGRSSFPALCDYIQDMAWRHYTNVEKALGNLLPSGQVWLMTRLEVEVINLPKWQDIIEVETWSRGIEKFYAFRDFVITGNDGKEAAKGTTTWVVLDTVNNKIARLTELASKWPSRAFVSSLGRDAEKIEQLTAPAYGPEYNVQYSDMDVNRHVNNVKYVKWMFDAAGMEYLEKHTVKKGIINFIDETRAGDVVKTGIVRANDLEICCSVIKNGSSKDASRAKFYFK